MLHVKRIFHYISVIFRNSVDTITWLMDNHSELATILNNKQQNAYHVCLEFNATESYQTLIRLHCSDLDIRAEDIFGISAITQWKKVMEAKREKGSSEFPHENAKTLILVPEPFDQHKTCENPPKRTVCHSLET